MATVKVIPDAVTDEIAAMFDTPFDGVSSFTEPLIPDVSGEFGIGLIVGPSGSGKSTILKQFGVQPVISWDETKAICSHFIDGKDAVDRLSGVGLNSIPAWLRPYHVLSTGEKFRADMARSLGDGAIIDEFSSVVDRNVARSCSVAAHRFIHRRNLRRIIFASCHYDIVEWLQPDWVFDTAIGEMLPRRSVQRPPIHISITPCAMDAWRLFSPHHYLSNAINKSARCWLATWNDEIVGFASVLAFPNGNFKNAFREHRTVVLPDYQGLGIGVRISDAVAELFVRDGCRYFSKTAHPRMGTYRDESDLWKPTTKNHKARKDYGSTKTKTKEDGHKMQHESRVCFSHEYVGIRCS
jgi:GNAT superfamily N-acetyltransferase